MRNAFQLLAAGAKVNNKDSSKTPTGSKASYTTCPLCQRTVPLRFADAHVSVCLATPRPSPQPFSQRRASGSLSTPGQDTSTPRAQLQAQQLTHLPAASHAQLAATQQPNQHLPHQHQQQPQDNSQHLWESQEGILDVGNCTAPDTGPYGRAKPTTVQPPLEAATSTPGLTPATASTPATATELSPPIATGTTVPAQPGSGNGEDHCQRQLRSEDAAQQQADQPPPYSSSTVPGLGPGPSPSQGHGGPRRSPAPQTANAFDIMRQSQLRAASCSHTFFLERNPEGNWLGHCWAKGCATAAQQRLAGSSCWSVNLTVGSGGRALATAAAAGDGAAMRGKETVVLMTNVPPGDGGAVSWSSGGLPSNDLPPEGRWRGGPSTLKSALQKAVRLGRGSCAVRVALHLVKEEGGAAQLLRRLSVVCVEDSILHPGLPLVVWLMAAQAKGFILGRCHVDALLRLVYQLAMVQVRDGLPDDPWDGGDPTSIGPTAAAGPGAASQVPASMQQVDQRGLAGPEGCLVKCLLFRASYGGMGGDVRMMRAFAGYWAARFKGTVGQPPPLPERSGRDSPSRQIPCSVLGLSQPWPPHAAGGGGLGLGGSGGCITQAPSADLSSQPMPMGVRVSDAYFAARLQAEDAPPSCTAFVPASQLLAEAASEQCSLRRIAATAAAAAATATAAAASCQQLSPSRFQSPAQPQGQLPTKRRHPEARGWPISAAVVNTQGGNGGLCLSPGLYDGGGGSPSVFDGPAKTGAGPWTRGSAVAAAPAACTTSPAAAASIPSPCMQLPLTQQLQRQLSEEDVVRPRWYAGGGGGGGGGGEGSARITRAGVAGGPVGGGDGALPSPWLAYLYRLYDQVPVPVALASVASVGPMRRSDVPLSAVDFHVSDVVTRLVERPELAALVPGGSGDGGRGSGAAVIPEDVEESLKSAMWLFRSSKNSKTWVHRLSPCCRAAAVKLPVEAADGGGDGGACAEHRSMEAQLAREDGARGRLAALWTAAAPWADRFSVSYIARRFGPP